MPSDLEHKLNSIAISEGKSRSEIVKESITQYIAKHESSLSPYALGKDLFGQSPGSSRDLASNRKKYLQEKLTAKDEKRHSVD